MNKQNINIKCDDRESGALVNELNKINVYCSPIRLKVGDYVCEELSLCIEYKTINDFCLSVMDGRIESQSLRMKDNYLHNYIIISGKINDKIQNIHENCIIGMISKLTYNNLNVIILDNEKQCAYIIRRLIERYTEKYSEQ